jgi:hypothetical protein
LAATDGPSKGGWSRSGGVQIGKRADSAAQHRCAQLGRGLLSLESRESITFVCIGDISRNTKEKTIMTLRSASSEGRVQDAHSGRPKVAIVTGGSSGIGLEMVKKTDRKGLSRGCELSEHYVRYDAPQHGRSETGGRRHWYRGNGQTCLAYRNAEFWNCRFAGKQRGRLHSQDGPARL